MKDGKFGFKRVRRRFRRPLRTGMGPVEAVERILIQTQSELGIGYGEVAPWPGFPTETTETAIEVLHSAQGSLSHLTAVVGASPQLPCLAAALSSCRHWDTIAAFGGSLPCAGLVTDDPQDFAKKNAAGFRTLKVKILPETTIDDVRSALANFDGALRLDANASLDLATARAWLEFVRSEPRIQFLEQPLPVGHAGYASLGTAKVALDESFLTPAGLEWNGPVIVKPLLVVQVFELKPIFTARHGKRPLVDRIVAHVGPSLAVPVKRMGSWAQAHVRVALPVRTVVHRAPARFGIVAHLVGVPTLTLHFAAEPYKVLSRPLVPRGFAAALGHIVSQSRAGFNGQSIGRKMRCFQFKCPSHLILPFPEAATGQTVDQVNAQILKTSVLGATHGVDGVLAPVRAAHPVESVVAKTLNPNAQTIKSFGAPQRHAVGRHVFGVDFERAFRIRLKHNALAQRSVQSAEFRVRKHAWRSAAPVQGAGGRFVRNPKFRLELHCSDHFRDLLEQR
mgnify:CR=1 FL=1